MLLVLLVPLLLQPAASIPMAAARATAARQPGACSRILTYPHLQVVMALNVPLLAWRADARRAVATGLRRRRADPKCVTLSSSGVLNFALDARGRLTRTQGFVTDLRSSKLILCCCADSSPGGLC